MATKVDWDSLTTSERIKTFEQILLASAAYGHFDKALTKLSSASPDAQKEYEAEVYKTLTDPDAGEMTQEQADYFISRFDVERTALESENDQITLFRDKVTGDSYVAYAGTKELSDWPQSNIPAVLTTGSTLGDSRDIAVLQGWQDIIGSGDVYFVGHSLGGNRAEYGALQFRGQYT